jgi:TetR/AcrR family transcriptional repressor of nem operon
MSAEHDDLPAKVQKQVQAFADFNIASLSKTLLSAGLGKRADSEARARSIFAAVSGAQLMARSRADISLFDGLIDGYRARGGPLARCETRLTQVLTGRQPSKRATLGPIR